jgi:hypothetical protein
MRESVCRKEKVMRFPRGLAALFAVALLAEPAVHAQMTGRLPEVAPQAGWIFTPSIGVGGAWDDNVLLVDTGGEPPADYASPVTPGVGLDYLGRRTRFSSGYEGAFVFYRTLDELRSFQHLFRASLTQRVNPRFALSIDESFTKAPTTDLLQVAGIPFYRIGSTNNFINGGFEAALSKHVSLRGSYGLRSVGFEFDPIVGAQLRGGTGHEVATSIERAMSKRLAIGGDYDFTHAIVAADPTIVNGPDDRFNLHRATFTARYVVSPSVSVNGGIGIAHIGAGDDHEAQTGPAWNGGVAYRAERVLMTANYTRSYLPSFGFGGTFQNEELSGSVHVPFYRNRAYTDGGIAWYNNEPFDLVQPSLKSLWISGRLGYRITPWIRVEGFYSHARQDSQRPGGKLGRNQIGFQIVTSKPMKLQ